MTMRPAQAGLTAESNSRTTLRRLWAGIFEALLPDLAAAASVVVGRHGTVVLPEAKGSVS